LIPNLPSFTEMFQFVVLAGIALVGTFVVVRVLSAAIFLSWAEKKKEILTHEYLQKAWYEKNTNPNNGKEVSKV